MVDYHPFCLVVMPYGYLFSGKGAHMNPWRKLLLFTFVVIGPAIVVGVSNFSAFPDSSLQLTSPPCYLTGNPLPSRPYLTISSLYENLSLLNELTDINANGGLKHGRPH